MHNVSAYWIAAQQENILPRATIKLTVGRPSSVLQGATVSTSGVGEYKTSSTQNLLAGTSVSSVRPVSFRTTSNTANNNYFSINEWVLDGTTNALVSATDLRNYVDANGNAVTYDGLYGQMTASTGYVEISFSSVVTQQLLGITITWSSVFNEFATKFSVVAYNGSTEVTRATITNNTDISTFVPLSNFVNYNKIRIYVTEYSVQPSGGSPVVRIERIALGDVLTIDQPEIIKCTTHQRIDLANFALPSSNTRVEIYNKDDAWNPSNPAGLTAILSNKQVCVAEFGYELPNGNETIYGAVLYLKNVVTPQNGITATLELSDALQYMDAPFDTENIYNADGTVDSGSTIAYYDGNGDPITLTNSALGQSPLLFLALQAIYQCKLPQPFGGAVYSIAFDSATDNYSIALPKGFSYSCAEVLQLCCNAGLRTLVADYRLRTYDFDLSTATAQGNYSIGTNVSYKYAEYDKQQQCVQVIVNDGDAESGLYPSGTVDTQNGAIQYLANPLVQHTAHAALVAMGLWHIEPPRQAHRRLSRGSSRRSWRQSAGRQ